MRTVRVSMYCKVRLALAIAALRSGNCVYFVLVTHLFYFNSVVAIFAYLYAEVRRFSACFIVRKIINK